MQQPKLSYILMKTKCMQSYILFELIRVIDAVLNGD